MASAQPLDFASLAPLIAERLLDKPNRAMSTAHDLRFGTHGSLSVDVEGGRFYDHESKMGGGMLDLIRHKLGCDTAGALAWLEEQGLKEVETVRHLEPHRHGATFYDYRDEQGTVLSRVKRTPDKRFLQLGPDGRGGFHAAKGCMEGVKRVPYRLPELLSADRSRVVFVVEGEKDADRLASAGLIATCNAEGAGKFRQELVRHFAGRSVVILPDNDRAGADHASDVAAKLSGTAAAVTVLLLPDLGPKEDVSDWLDRRGGSIARLKELAAAALESPSLNADAGEGAVETLPLIDLASWASFDPAPRVFALEKLMPAGEVTLFTGPGGVGKSQLAQQMATCFALGLPLFGLATAGGPTIYVTAEDDERELHWRQAHICKALGISMHDLAGKLFPISLRGRLNNELATFDHEGRLRTTPSYDLLRATVEKVGAKLVFLDNVAHLFAGNENDRSQVTAFANLLAALCRDFGCTVVLIGHPNKVGDDYSGSTAWLNAVRSQITLKRPDDDGADPDARVLALGKANYARSGEQIGFRWHDFAFVSDAELPADQRDEIAANVQASGDNAIFLRCLAERNKQRRAVSERHSPTYAPRQFTAMAESKAIGRVRLERAMDRLFRIGAIERAELWRGDDRKPVFGLRETVTRTYPAGYPQSPNLAENRQSGGAGNTMRSTAREQREMPSETAENRAGDADNTHTYTTYSPGAADAAAAPDTERQANPILNDHCAGAARAKFPTERGGKSVDLSRVVFGPEGGIEPATTSEGEG